MPDPSLHGNGEPCPACTLRREAEDTSLIKRPDVECNLCLGTGRIGYTREAIIAAHVAWAREHYWPAFDARIAAAAEAI